MPLVMGKFLTNVLKTLELRLRKPKLQHVEITNKFQVFAHAQGIRRQRFEITGGIGAERAESVANPQKFPVKFPVLREFADQG